MKRLQLLILALLPLLTATAQIQVNVTKNSGEKTVVNNLKSIELNDSAEAVTLYADSTTTLPMSELKHISFGRDYLPWNLSWKEEDGNYGGHYFFGYSAIMHVRDVMTGDMTRSDDGYDHFSSWAKNINQGKNYLKTQYVWGYMRDMVMEANQWITACKEDDSKKGLLGVAYASRALLYLDLAQMYEFLPNDRTSPISLSGRDITGLTVPIITEDTDMDPSQGYYSAYRAPRQEMASFILSDLDKAEQLLPLLQEESSLLPHLDVAYGLKARLFLWIGDYANAQRYARLAIDAATTKPMTSDEMLSPTKGFNDPACWMWGVKYYPEDDAVDSGIVNWTSWLSNQTTFGYGGVATGMYLYIDRGLYNHISDTDIRKLLWVGPSGSTLNTQIQHLVSPSYGSFSQYLPAYASVKFRPAEGNTDDYSIGAASAFPLMRVEEMYFIEAEAAAQMGQTAMAKRLLINFMQQYRDNDYQCNISSAQEVIDEIVLQKRIELWGEGQTFFDVKRLNLSVTRDYDGTIFPYERQFNTQGRPAWMNLVFPLTEENYCIGMCGQNNPDPSDVYQPYWEPANEDSLRQRIHGTALVLNTPKFIDKIPVLPLDSVQMIHFSYRLPSHEAGVSFESQLQMSLSPFFPLDRTIAVNTSTSSDSIEQPAPSGYNLSMKIRSLRKLQGMEPQGETTVYLRARACVDKLPTIQFTSNTVSFRVMVTEEPTSVSGYSYAPRLKVASAGILDMERLAGLESFKACQVSLEGEGEPYSSSSYEKEYPLRLNLNLWNMGFYVNGQGMVSPRDLSYDQTISLYKVNWGEQFTGKPAEYPGQQHYVADVTGYALRDDLVFSLMSDTFGVDIIINRQAWEEYDYSWQNGKSIVMRSEMMPDHEKVFLEEDPNARAWRLQEPYAKGHNIMLFAGADTLVTIPRQYAYTDTWGQSVYASGKGFYNGDEFDMEVTFFNADSTMSIVRHEVFGSRPNWVPVYQGSFSSGLFGDGFEGVIYHNTSDPGHYKLIPFLYSQEGLAFTWDKEDNSISFEKQPTGYTHPTYGMIMAQDNYGRGGEVEITENGPVFHFYIRYTVDAGSFGTFEETFTTTGNLPTRNAAVRKAPARKDPTEMRLIPDGPLPLQVREELIIEN